LRVQPGVGLGIDVDPDKLARYRTDKHWPSRGQPRGTERTRERRDL